MFHDHLDYFQRSPLGGKTWRPLHSEISEPLIYYMFIMCEHLAWTVIHWHSIWLRVWSHMTSHYNWGLVTTLHDFESVLGWPMNTSFGLSHFMVTALGSCVKWPLRSLIHSLYICNSHPHTVLVILPCKPHSPNFSWMPSHFLSLHILISNELGELTASYGLVQFEK